MAAQHAHIDAKTEDERTVLPPGCDPAFTTLQASAYTGLAEKTLEGLRLRGGGPRFVRYSRNAVRYRKSALDDWMASLEVASTSEQRAA